MLRSGAFKPSRQLSHRAPTRRLLLEEGSNEEGKEARFAQQSLGELQTQVGSSGSVVSGADADVRPR